MITGTIYNAGKMLEMTQKWEQKKLSGNILKKEDTLLSPEEQQIRAFEEQLEKNREGSEYSTIYAKIQSGRKLSPEEEDKLREKDPKMYMEYKAEQMEQKAYEKRLKSCKTKEEAEKLHVNKLSGKLSELKSIVNNPNIPKSEKVKAAQRILGETTKTVQIFQAFTASVDFKKLPTEEELLDSRQIENKSQEEPIETEKTEVDTNSVQPNSDALETEKKIMEEMFELEKKHLGETKKAAQIDVVL